MREAPESVPEDEREALLTVAHGAVVTSGGVSLRRVLLTATEFVLTRGLGAVVYGVYALAWRLAQLLLRFVNFGSVQTLQRYVPAAAGDPGRRGRIAGLAYATTLLVGLAVTGVLAVAAAPVNDLTVAHPAFPPALRLFGLMIVLLGVVKIHAALLRAVGSARGEVLFNRVLPPAVRLACATAALALGFSVVGVAGALAAGTGALALAGLPTVIRATDIRPTLRGVRREAREFYNHATPIGLSSIGKIFQNRVDIVLVGLLLTATDAGVYNVVLVLVAIAWIPLKSFNQLLPPVASDLHAAGETETLNAVYSAVTRLILTTVLPIIAVQVVFGRALLAAFGGTFVAGYPPLVAYLGGVLVGSTVGATGWLLMMTDHQYARMVLDWLLAAGNVALTYLFVVEFGLVGAALGTAAAIAIQNSIQVVLLRRFEGLWPFDATYLRPVAASLVMAGAMFVVRAAIGGAAGPLVGVPVGLVVYVGALLAIGVPARDRLVVRELATRYRDGVTAAVTG
ncbi:MAG: lipopolysaccharide biosynthesis protein [Haloarculaceae archaeon]